MEEVGREHTRKCRTASGWYQAHRSRIAALTMLTVDPEVHFWMMPIQKSSRPSPYDKDPKDKGGKGKGKKGKEGKGTDGPPEGCHHRTPQNMPICYGYNHGFCKSAADGTAKGASVASMCAGNVSRHSHTHRANIDSPQGVATCEAQT